MKTDNWRNLYREGWGKRLCPPSYSHPAKVNYGLSVRIYEHALAEGWIEPGGIVLDPFAGIGGFALEAMRHGLNFVGCELEMRFCDMGQGCDCTGISKVDWVRFQDRWGRARHKDGRHWCPECIMKAAVIAGERKFKVAEKRKIKPLPLPGTKWGTLAKTRQAALFDAAPSTSYVRNSGQIPCTRLHHYRGNIETWEQDGMPGTAVIVQGDSRRLTEVLERASLCLSSPPYAGSIHSGGHGIDAEKLVGNKPGPNSQALVMDGYGIADGQLAQMPKGDLVLAISSPPFLAQSGGTNVTAQDGPLADASLLKRHSAGNQAAGGYGTADGQLAALPEGSHAEACLRRQACERPAIAISSPPFMDQLPGGPSIEFKERPGGRAFGAGQAMLNDYGSEQGQLGQMPPGDHAAALEAGAEMERAQACISSPPWENQIPSHDNFMPPHVSESNPSAPQMLADYDTTYGATAGQLGQQQGSTFWAASRQILEEVYKVLAPGGHAIFVCKRFVRAGKIVEFSTQWARLCEAVGFTWIHHHKAWLVEDRGGTAYAGG